MTVENRSIDRRTIVKGAAWSTPVLAAAMATPAFAATPDPTVIDLEISRQRCTVVGLIDRPYFGVRNAGNVAIPAGTTLRLTSGNGFGFDLSLPLLSDSPGFDIAILENNEGAEFTLTEPLARGASTRVNFLPFRTLDIGLNRNATLELVSLPEGYVDENESNNSTRMSWSGVNLLGVSVYSCSG